MRSPSMLLGRQLSVQHIVHSLLLAHCKMSVDLIIFFKWLKKPTTDVHSI